MYRIFSLFLMVLLAFTPFTASAQPSKSSLYRSYENIIRTSYPHLQLAPINEWKESDFVTISAFKQQLKKLPKISTSISRKPFDYSNYFGDEVVKQLVLKVGQQKQVIWTKARFATQYNEKAKGQLIQSLSSFETALNNKPSAAWKKGSHSFTVATDRRKATVTFSGFYRVNRLVLAPIFADFTYTCTNVGEIK